jgi:hypothetical protein
VTTPQQQEHDEQSDNSDINGRLHYLESIAASLLMQVIAERLRSGNSHLSQQAKALSDYFAEHGVPYSTFGEDGYGTEYVSWHQHMLTGLAHFLDLRPRRPLTRRGTRRN